MPKFRKKPVVIEAIQWTGNNGTEMSSFIKNVFRSVVAGGAFQIHTLEGVMTASIGDWIIKGVSGEIYPCKPDIFEKTYEPVDETPRSWIPPTI